MITRILRCLTLAGLLLAPVFSAPAAHAKGFGAYTADIKPQDVFPDADRFGPSEGNPPAMAAFKGEEILGYVFETNDIGYSGKPIKLLVGMDKTGVIRGAKVVEHHEPILLVGIPPEKLTAFVDAYVGRNVVAKVDGEAKSVDAISGATVTAIVINDGISRAALQIAKAHGLAGFDAAATDTRKRELSNIQFAKADWQTMLGDGSVRRMHLLNSDVDAAFTKIGVGSPEPYARAGVPTEQFVDLYIALVSVEGIGRNLLGDAEFQRLQKWLKPGQQAILIAANGDYSFRGSGFVRGGIFDRFQLQQDQPSILFKDHDYRRMRDLPDRIPAFTEVGLFRIPEGLTFDPPAD